MSDHARLSTVVASLPFQNPILLAAGTAAYGRELADVMNIDALGGFVTKAVSVEPRQGAPAPRVAEFDGGMMNAVGLANPGLDAVRDHELPWLATHLPHARKIVNVVGNAVDEFERVVGTLEAAAGTWSAERSGGIDGFELNLSCPNTRAGGIEFGADPETLAAVVATARRATRRALFVKLSPTLPKIADAAQAAVDSGADAITLVNTLPGLLVDVERRRPVLGFGTGGVSGAALLPIGVLATWRVSRTVRAPILGIGGVRTATDALQYLMAGASLVGVGTAALRDPRQPERIVRALDRWCERHDVASIRDVVGTLEWPT